MHKSYFFTTLNTAFFISLRPYITFVKQANEVMNTAELKKCTGTKVERGKATKRTRFLHRALTDCFPSSRCRNEFSYEIA